MSYPAKKLINSPYTCVEDMLNGVKAAFPGLSVNTSSKIVMRCQNDSNDCVGIVSGGGSGHEPFCAGFVGKGMLNAAVCGSVFAAPPARNCLTAIQNVAEHNRGGVIVLIPNYTGDILNFAQAVETARDQGYKVESIIVGEDCALLNRDDEERTRIVGKRGLCGQLFMFKFAGALACSGYNMATILETCNKVLTNMASLGVCTFPCTLPGANRPLFQLDPDFIELGLGVHGEAGVTKINMCSANEIVQIILRKIFQTLSLKSGDEVCAIINNLGSSTQMESYIIAGEVSKELGSYGILLRRMYVGSMLTSLDMGGIQVCLLRTTDNKEWINLLDQNTEAFAWPGQVLSYDVNEKLILETVDYTKELIGPEMTPKETEMLKNCLLAVASRLRAAEEKLNLLDSGCGDGDCGTTLRHLSDGIIESLHNLSVNRPTSCFLELAEIASEIMGGTSGGIYSLLLTGAARMVPDWPSAFGEAIETVKRYSPARVGSRTMMDALIPAYDEFVEVIKTEDWLSALAAAVKKAEAGCEATRNMEAKCGRASYVNKSYLNDVDAGAFGVTVWLNAIYEELRGKNIT